MDSQTPINEALARELIACKLDRAELIAALDELTRATAEEAKATAWKSATNWPAVTNLTRDSFNARQAAMRLLAKVQS